MRHDANVTGAWTQMTVHGLEGLGIDVHGLCQLRGLDYAELVDPDARVPADALALLWRVAEQRTGDRHLGLHAAERVEPVVNHVHAHLLLSARNLREGLLALARTLPLVGHGVGLEVEERAGAFAVRFRHARGDMPPGRHPVEFAAVVLRRIYGISRGGPLPLREVEFSHPHPGDHAEHERVLECPVRFGCPAEVLVVDREVMLRPSPHYSAELVSRLQEIAEGHLARITQPTFSAELRSLLRSRLGRRPCDADSIAAELHMSLRTLQRRLESEQVPFSRVLDAARRQLTLELLDRDLPLQEVAQRCGLSGARALIRAFRRWTGTTPAAYRAAACAGASQAAGAHSGR